MKEILLVGSIGIDDIETAKSKVEGAVGGAAIYFSYAASYFANVNLVGVAGIVATPRYVSLPCALK